MDTVLVWVLTPPWCLLSASRWISYTLIFGQIRACVCLFKLQHWSSEQGLLRQIVLSERKELKVTPDSMKCQRNSEGDLLPNLFYINSTHDWKKTSLWVSHYITLHATLNKTNKCELLWWVCIAEVNLNKGFHWSNIKINHSVVMHQQMLSMEVCMEATVTNGHDRRSMIGVNIVIRSSSGCWRTDRDTLMDSWTAGQLDSWVRHVQGCEPECSDSVSLYLLRWNNMEAELPVCGDKTKRIVRNVLHMFDWELKL